MAIEIIFQFIARNPPSIAILGGIMLWLIGSLMGMSDLVFWGTVAFVCGFILQVLWIFFVPH